MITDYEAPAAVPPSLSPPSDTETHPAATTVSTHTAPDFIHALHISSYAKPVLTATAAKRINNITGEHISTNQRACLCLFLCMEEDAHPLLESVEPTNE